MKKILYIIAASFVLFSCNDKLDKFPLDKLSDGDFFSTETGLQTFSNAFYTAFPGADGRSGEMLAFDNADNMFMDTQTNEVRGIRQIPSSGSGWSFTSLRNINTLLDNLSQCPDESTRLRYEAIARFFRGYFYFYLIKRFGDVPWYDHQIASDSEDLYKARDSRDFVMQKVVEDLEFAVKNLSSDKSVYQISKWTAEALLSRATLFEGTFRKYHTEYSFGTEAKSAEWYLNKCAEVSYDFINNSGYKLYNTGNPKSDYLNLFAAGKYGSHAANCEVVLARNYNATYGVKHCINNITLVSSMGRPGLTRKQVCSYLMADGSRFTDKKGWETMTFFEETQNRDPRLAQSIRTPGYKRIGGTTMEAPTLKSTISGYQPIKYVSEPGENNIYDTYGESDCDVILFRAGEVYLNYAEAKAELGTINETDLAISVNKTRSRAGMPALSLSVTEDPFLTDPNWGGYQNVTGAFKALILEIRRERSVELGGEGFRYNDLMRWKEGKILEYPQYGMYFPGPGAYDLDGNGSIDVYLYESGKKDDKISASFEAELGKDITLSEGTSGMINPYKNSPGNWNDDKDYLYPIPYGEIQLNPNLVQNPGWVL